MTPPRLDREPGRPLTHREIMVVLSGLLLGVFLSALDQTVVSTAMRTIADELHGQTAQAWVTTAYLITATISTPLYGKLSDLYGRKPFFLFAIVVFVAGSALCGTAGSIYSLAVWRAVQGLGAGGLMALAFTIVSDIVPPRERGRYQAYFMGVFGSSSVLGPVIGGALAGQESILGISGWRWIFYVNVPIGLLALVVVVRKLHLPRRRTEHRLDVLGAVLLSVAVVPVLLLAEKGRDWGWSSPLSLGLLVLSLVGVGLFLPWQARMGDEALLPTRLFRNSVFSVASASSFLVGMGMFGGLICLPLYLQIVRGSSPTEAGLQTVPLMVGIIGTGMLAGRVMRRTGRYKRFPVVGTALLTVSMLLFSRLEVDTPLWEAMLVMVLMGAGLGLTMQMLVIAVQNALPPKDLGVATSSNTFFRSMGGAFGAAVSLALLFGSLIGHVQERARAAGVPDAVLARFADESAFDDTSIIATLPPALRRAVIEGFTDSVALVFLVGAVVMALAHLLTWFLREVPLREHSGLEERARAEAAELARAETAVV